MKNLWKIFLESLRFDGQGSEKRCTKFLVVVVLLLITICDSFFNGLREEVLITWFTLIGFDGYRTTQEKKMSQPTAVLSETEKPATDEVPVA